MATKEYYILRAFHGEQEVVTTTVALGPGNAYPRVGESIDDRWRVAEILDSPKPGSEYWVRVTEL